MKHKQRLCVGFCKVFIKCVVRILLAEEMIDVWDIEKMYRMPVHDRFHNWKVWFRRKNSPDIESIE